MRTAEQQAHYEEFLRELAALLRKYGMSISSCGCCDGAGASESDDPQLVSSIRNDLGAELKRIGENDRAKPEPPIRRT